MSGDLGQLPLVDLKAQYASIKPEIDQALADVLESQFFVLGPAVERFENEFASYLGAAHCVALQSGTAALWLGLWAAGIKPGDEVITTPLTFFATAEAILLCGAKPVFVDVDEKTLNINPALVEAAVTPRTRAIVPVHLYGQPADMDALNAIARKKNLIVLEDAAQAAGSLYKSRKAGTLAPVAAFSFYPGKNLGAYGDAGAVVTSDGGIARRLRLLRNHGMPVKNKHDLLGVNARLEAFQGAVLSVKLKKLDSWNAARRRHAEVYRELLGGVPGLSIVEERPDCRSNYHLFVVRHPRRDALLEHLRSRGIQADIHYPVAGHLQPACGEAVMKPGSLPVAERAVGEILSLPMFPELTHAQIGRVASALRDFTDAA